MSEETCNHDCGSCAQECDQRSFRIEPNADSHIKKIIGVVSGKGGVGKSFVSGLLAVQAAKKGYRTGILDADITGPSVPKMFGVRGPLMGNGDGILPATTRTGISVMSINLMLENEDDPVIWRGPMINGAVQQFFTDVVWGDLDVMFVDMPPGTGDVALTVFQSLPIDGLIIVTTPQELVSMIVGKAVKMARTMDVPILGVIENMSYVVCPDCGRKIPVFGESHLDQTAAEYQIPVLGRIPFAPEAAAACDQGLVETVTGDFLDEAMNRIAQLIEEDEG